MRRGYNLSGRSRGPYTENSRNAALDGQGHLLITARRETATGPDGIRRKYTSARLTTHGKVAVRPGSYVEAAIKLPVGQGVWPAFWLLGSNSAEVGWPASGELDIVEVFGSDPRVARSRLHMPDVHDSDQNRKYGGGLQGGNTTFSQSLDSQFHQYGVYFDAAVVVFYIDRRPTFSYTALEARSSNRDWPFGKSQDVLLNIAIGGSEKSPKATAFPRVMQVGAISIWDGVPF